MNSLDRHRSSRYTFTRRGFSLFVVCDAGAYADSCGFTGKGDLQNSPPGFDPKDLQWNGGPTSTLALEPDSAAVDHIPVGINCPATDQRGVSRPQGPTCDIGAFEITSADGLTVIVHLVNSFHLNAIVQKTLDTELGVAIIAVKAKSPRIAIVALDVFITDVQALRGKVIPPAQTIQLVKNVRVVKNRLGRA
ncbi:MAG: choice-of-anchor Q domain-containing protein [Ktedonobacteraceae bacterium]